jgi:hypothetical protein
MAGAQEQHAQQQQGGAPPGLPAAVERIERLATGQQQQQQQHQLAAQRLQQLAKWPVTPAAVKECNVGKRLTALSKHSSSQVASAAAACIAAWKAHLAAGAGGAR